MTKSIRERYPGPWTIREMNECFTVRARDETILAHVFYEDELPTRRRLMERVTRAEAYALAKAFAALADVKDEERG